MSGLTPRDWTIFGTFGCIFVAMIISGIYGLGRDKNWKWQVTTEGNRVPGFFVALFVVAAFALFFFGPKGS